MKKIISLMLAVTMICASIGLTAFAATTTTVEAEADGVSAYTLPSSDKSNSKILKNTVSSKESVTYYIQANNTPRATMFKLAQVNTGDKINVDINFTYLDTATMELEYCLFVSDSEITLTSHSQDLVKEELEKHTDESNIKNWSTNKSNMKYSLPNGITASKDGYVYLYIGCGDLSEDKTQVTKKIQWSIDSFDVNIDSDGGGETEPDTTPTPTTTINPDVTPTPTPTASPTPTPTLEPELTLDEVYSSNMVLQRKEPITITGTGKSGNTVSVNFNGADEQTTIEHGLWEITLPAMEAVKSATMTVSSGDNMITLDNVAVGDVIFCTGQSNMFNRLETFPTLMNEELSEAYEDVRYMNSFDEISEWKVATMENSKQFSALGFLIGKRMIKKDSDVPIGLISSSLGGSSIMQWIPTYSVNWDSQAKRMMAGASSKGGLYTQRLLPLKNLKASAVVWYQGEANTTFESGTVYEQALTSLINNWRKTFNDEDLPFVVVQLPTANFAKIYSTIRIGTGVRAGQWNVSQRMDNVKTVVSNDTGTTNNVHPNDKGPIADRAVAYIEDFINNTQSNVESPSFDYMERSGDKLILHFKNTYGSLSTDDGGVPLGFELKDDDGIYKDVTPTINGDTIEIDVTDITNPQVKYAWSDTPGIAKDLVEAQTDTPAVINTFNAAGRPIAPFMTDLTEKYASKAVNKELSTTEFYNYAPYISKVEQSGDDIVISAYDTDGVVSKVEVYIDEGEIKAGDAKQRDDGKWVFTPDVTSGVHSVYAIATDNDNINSLTCVDYPTYNIIRPTRYDYVKGYTESPSSVEYNNGDDMLAKATNDVNGTTTTVTSAIPTGETTKSLKLSATGNKATANATIPISKADNPQKTLTIEYDTMFESADDAIGASRGMYAKTKEGNELWLTYFTASSLRTAITNTGGNWCYEQAMSIKNNQWHHIKLELHPNTGIFSVWLDGTMLQDNVSFVKEGSSFDTCKGAFDTLKEGITDLRFYHTASNNIENATYIDNVKVTEVSYSEEEIIPPAKIQEATPQISIDYINETLTGFESQEPYTIKVGEGNAKDITLGEDVTTISLDDEKIGYAGDMQSFTIIKKARNADNYIDSEAQLLTVPARSIMSDDIKIDNATEKITIPTGYKYGTTSADYTTITTDGKGETVTVAPSEKIYLYKSAVTTGENKMFKSVVKTFTAPARKEIGEVKIDFNTETINTTTSMQYSTYDETEWTNCTDTNMSVTAFDSWDGSTEKVVKFHIPSDEDNYASEVVSVTIPARPSIPNITGVAPTTNGGQGKLTGTTTAMEYKTADGGTWADCSDVETPVDSGSYIVRIKATATSFVGTETTIITVPPFSAIKEDTPKITVNYNDELLEGFIDGASYTITVDTDVAEKIAPTDGKLAIAEKYINKTISIVRKASDANHVDSTVQTITLGSRAAQPTGLTGIKPTAENGNGKITGTTADMQYKEKDNNEDTWHDCTVTETEVTAGKTYIVRIKAIVDGEFKRFASICTEVEVGEYVAPQPSKTKENTPQISIDYINETLTGFTVQEPYTIKVGEGITQDITLDDNVTTISLDDEKIGYAGELLSIEIVKKARNTETYTDSDVQQLTVKARPKAPTTVQGVNATEIGGKGKLTGMNGMQYKLKRTDEWSSTQLVDTVEVDAGEYNVRKAATDTDFASEETTITVETFIAEKEMTPEIAIDYTTEELINFVEDGTYTINGLDVTLTDNKLSLANYITNEQITLSIVKKGNNVTTVASEAQTLIVKARPAAPTKSEIIVTQPSVIGGKGTIAGIADTMEYSTNNGINWTTGDGDDIGDIEPGTTYKIRYKAVSADEEAERQFKSAEYSVTIIAYDAMPETQPTILINYVNEKLTGFTEGCDYIIKIDDGVATDKDNVTEDIDIDNTYFGHTLKIVKKGDGIKTSNSEAFELSIPKRSSAPNVAAVEEQTYQGNDGKITGVDTTMEYKSLSEPTFTWTQCAGTEITNLAPGSYVVRVAAVADESFASEVMSVTINAAAKDEPTEPTVNITYDDKNGNVNAIFTNITEEGMVYVAEYNENGTLLSIKSDEISDSVIIPFTCVNKSKVKVFIWKNDMKPLFNKVFTLN